MHQSGESFDCADLAPRDFEEDPEIADSASSKRQGHLRHNPIRIPFGMALSLGLDSGIPFAIVVLS